MSTDRDRSIETLLRQRHKDDELPSVAQCIDPEVLAAWVDGALSDQALAEAEKHAAGCGRCQALLASMAKATPAAEPRSWWRAVSAKWLVPAAAVVTALLVWVSVGPRREPATLRPAPSAATSPRPEAAPAVITPEPPPSGQPAQSYAYSARERDVEAKKDAVLEQAGRRAGAAGGRNIAVAPQRVDALDKTADAVSARPRAGSAGGVAAAPSPVLPPAAAAAAEPAPASPPSRPEPSAFGAPPPLPQPRAVPAETSVAESVKITPQADAKQLAAAFRTSSEIRSPQPDYRWRIVPPSGIHRSVDGGVTWSVVDPVPVQGAVGGLPALVLTTGSSPSRDVCWIVGRAGVVLVTTDGATWQRRPGPGSADLIGIRTDNARAATVTTADGHQYATSDGGATWTLVK